MSAKLLQVKTDDDDDSKKTLTQSKFNSLYNQFNNATSRAEKRAIKNELKKYDSVEGMRTANTLEKIVAKPWAGAQSMDNDFQERFHNIWTGEDRSLGNIALTVAEAIPGTIKGMYQGVVETPTRVASAFTKDQLDQIDPSGQFMPDEDYTPAQRLANLGYAGVEVVGDIVGPECMVGKAALKMAGKDIGRKAVSEYASKTATQLQKSAARSYNAKQIAKAGLTEGTEEVAQEMFDTVKNSGGDWGEFFNPDWNSAIEQGVLGAVGGGLIGGGTVGLDWGRQWMQDSGSGKYVNKKGESWQSVMRNQNAVNQGNVQIPEMYGHDETDSAIFAKSYQRLMNKELSKKDKRPGQILATMVADHTLAPGQRKSGIINLVNQYEKRNEAQTKSNPNITDEERRLGESFKLWSDIYDHYINQASGGAFNSLEQAVVAFKNNSIDEQRLVDICNAAHNARNAANNNGHMYVTGHKDPGAQEGSTVYEFLGWTTGKANHHSPIDSKQANADFDGDKSGFRPVNIGGANNQDFKTNVMEMLQPQDGKAFAWTDKDFGIFLEGYADKTYLDRLDNIIDDLEQDIANHLQSVQPPTDLYANRELSSDVDLLIGLFKYIVKYVCESPNKTELCNECNYTYGTSIDANEENAVDKVIHFAFNELASIVGMRGGDAKNVVGGKELSTSRFISDFVMRLLPTPEDRWFNHIIIDDINGVKQDLVDNGVIADPNQNIEFSDKEVIGAPESVGGVKMPALLAQVMRGVFAQGKEDYRNADSFFRDLRTGVYYSLRARNTSFTSEDETIAFIEKALYMYFRLESQQEGVVNSVSSIIDMTVIDNMQQNSLFSLENRGTRTVLDGERSMSSIAREFFNIRNNIVGKIAKKAKDIGQQASSTQRALSLTLTDSALDAIGRDINYNDRAGKKKFIDSFGSVTVRDNLIESFEVSWLENNGRDASLIDLLNTVLYSQQPGLRWEDRKVSRSGYFPVGKTVSDDDIDFINGLIDAMKPDYNAKQNQFHKVVVKETASRIYDLVRDWVADHDIMKGKWNRADGKFLAEALNALYTFFKDDIQLNTGLAQVSRFFDKNEGLFEKADTVDKLADVLELILFKQCFNDTYIDTLKFYAAGDIDFARLSLDSHANDGVFQAFAASLTLEEFIKLSDMIQGAESYETISTTMYNDLFKDAIYLPNDFKSPLMSFIDFNDSTFSWETNLQQSKQYLESSNELNRKTANEQITKLKGGFLRGRTGSEAFKMMAQTLSFQRSQMVDNGLIEAIVAEAQYISIAIKEKGVALKISGYMYYDMMRAVTCGGDYTAIDRISYELGVIDFSELMTNPMKLQDLLFSKENTGMYVSVDGSYYLMTRNKMWSILSNHQVDFDVDGIISRPGYSFEERFVDILSAACDYTPALVSNITPLKINQTAVAGEVSSGFIKTSASLSDAFGSIYSDFLTITNDNPAAKKKYQDNLVWLHFISNSDILSKLPYFMNVDGTKTPVENAKYFKEKIADIKDIFVNYAHRYAYASNGIERARVIEEVSSSVFGDTLSRFAKVFRTEERVDRLYTGIQLEDTLEDLFRAINRNMESGGYNALATRNDEMANAYQHVFNEISNGNIDQEELCNYLEEEIENINIAAQVDVSGKNATGEEQRIRQNVVNNVFGHNGALIPIMILAARMNERTIAVNGQNPVLPADYIRSLFGIDERSAAVANLFDSYSRAAASADRLINLINGNQSLSELTREVDWYQSILSQEQYGQDDTVGLLGQMINVLSGNMLVYNQATGTIRSTGNMYGVYQGLMRSIHDIFGSISPIIDTNMLAVANSFDYSETFNGTAALRPVDSLNDRCRVMGVFDGLAARFNTTDLEQLSPHDQHSAARIANELLLSRMILDRNPDGNSAQQRARVDHEGFSVAVEFVNEFEKACEEYASAVRSGSQLIDGSVESVGLIDRESMIEYLDENPKSFGSLESDFTNQSATTLAAAISYEARSGGAGRRVGTGGVGGIRTVGPIGMIGDVKAEQTLVQGTVDDIRTFLESNENCSVWFRMNGEEYKDVRSVTQLNEIERRVQQQNQQGQAGAIEWFGDNIYLYKSAYDSRIPYTPTTHRSAGHSVLSYICFQMVEALALKLRKSPKNFTSFDLNGRFTPSDPKLTRFTVVPSAVSQNFVDGPLMRSLANYRKEMYTAIDELFKDDDVIREGLSLTEIQKQMLTLIYTPYIAVNIKDFAPGLNMFDQTYTLPVAGLTDQSLMDFISNIALDNNRQFDDVNTVITFEFMSVTPQTQAANIRNTWNLLRRDANNTPDRLQGLITNVYNNIDYYRPGNAYYNMMFKVNDYDRYANENSNIEDSIVSSISWIGSDGSLGSKFFAILDSSPSNAILLDRENNISDMLKKMDEEYRAIHPESIRLKELSRQIQYNGKHVQDVLVDANRDVFGDTSSENPRVVATYGFKEGSFVYQKWPVETRGELFSCDNNVSESYIAIDIDSLSKEEIAKVFRIGASNAGNFSVRLVSQKARTSDDFLSRVASKIGRQVSESTHNLVTRGPESTDAGRPELFYIDISRELTRAISDSYIDTGVIYPLKRQYDANNLTNYVYLAEPGFGDSTTTTFAGSYLDTTILEDGRAIGDVELSIDKELQGGKYAVYAFDQNTGFVSPDLQGMPVAFNTAGRATKVVGRDNNGIRLGFSGVLHALETTPDQFVLLVSTNEQGANSIVANVQRMILNPQLLNISENGIVLGSHDSGDVIALKEMIDPETQIHYIIPVVKRSPENFDRYELVSSSTDEFGKIHLECKYRIRVNDYNKFYQDTKDSKGVHVVERVNMDDVPRLPGSDVYIPGATNKHTTNDKAISDGATSVSIAEGCCVAQDGFAVDDDNKKPKVHYKGTLFGRRNPVEMDEIVFSSDDCILTQDGIKALYDVLRNGRGSSAFIQNIRDYVKNDPQDQSFAYREDFIIGIRQAYESARRAGLPFSSFLSQYEFDISTLKPNIENGRIVSFTVGIKKDSSSNYLLNNYKLDRHNFIGMSPSRVMAFFSEFGSGVFKTDNQNNATEELRLCAPEYANRMSQSDFINNYVLGWDSGEHCFQMRVKPPVNDRRHGSNDVICQWVVIGNLKQDAKDQADRRTPSLEIGSKSLKIRNLENFSVRPDISDDTIDMMDNDMARYGIYSDNFGRAIALYSERSREKSRRRLNTPRPGDYVGLRANKYSAERAVNRYFVEHLERVGKIGRSVCDNSTNRKVVKDASEGSPIIAPGTQEYEAIMNIWRDATGIMDMPSWVIMSFVNLYTTQQTTEGSFDTITEDDLKRILDTLARSWNEAHIPVPASQNPTLIQGNGGIEHHSSAVCPRYVLREAFFFANKATNINVTYRPASYTELESAQIEAARMQRDFFEESRFADNYGERHIYDALVAYCSDDWEDEQARREFFVFNPLGAARFGEIDAHQSAFLNNAVGAGLFTQQAVNEITQLNAERKARQNIQANSYYENEKGVSRKRAINNDSVTPELATSKNRKTWLVYLKHGIEFCMVSKLASVQTFLSAFPDTLLYSYMVNLNTRLGMKGVGRFRLSADSYSSCLTNDEIVEISKNPEFAAMFRLLEEAGFTESLDEIFAEMANSENKNLHEALQDAVNKRFNNKWDKAVNTVLNMAGGGRTGIELRSRTFIAAIQALASQDAAIAPFLFGPKDQNGDSLWMVKMRQDPVQAVMELMTQFPAARKIVLNAKNIADEGTAGSLYATEVIVREIARRHKVFEFFNKTMFCPFLKYNVSIQMRVFNQFFPVSMLRFLLLKYVGESNMRIIGTGGLTFRDLNLAEQTGFEQSLHAAFVTDVQRMGMSALIVMLICCSGALEPPDDEDKMCNLEEWTVFGLRVQTSWWLRDMFGAPLALAATVKSCMNGTPKPSIFLRAMGQWVYNNPLTDFDVVYDMICDPESLINNKYNDEIARFDEMKDGDITEFDMIAATALASTFNWLSGFVTPAFLKKLYRSSSEYEHSYKTVYKEDASGNLVEGDDGTYSTEETTYLDAKLRQVAQKQPVFAALADLFSDSSTSYWVSEQPRVKIYDPLNMASLDYFTFQNEDGTEKTAEEKEAIALVAISTMLDYSSMDDLAATGFYLPYDVWDYVGDVVYDIWYNAGEAEAEFIATGKLGQYQLGDEDFELTTQEQAELLDAMHNTQDFWLDFYENKLQSEAMRRELQVYNMTNTTWNKDENGEWYATGYKQRFADVLPVGIASGTLSDAGNTGGYENDWQTISAVNPDYTTGTRALVPVTSSYRDKVDFYYHKGTNGYSNSSGYSSGGYSSGGSGSRHTVYSRAQTVYPTAPYAGNTSNPKRASYDYLKPVFATYGSKDAAKRSNV